MKMYEIQKEENALRIRRKKTHSEIEELNQQLENRKWEAQQLEKQLFELADLRHRKVAHLVHLEMELEKTEARLVELADIGDWKVTPILTAKKTRLEHLIREAKESM